MKDAAAAKASADGGGAKTGASASAAATSEGGGNASTTSKGKEGEEGAEADPEAEAAAERVRRALDIRGRIRDSSRMPVVEGEVCRVLCVVPGVSCLPYFDRSVSTSRLAR